MNKSIASNNLSLFWSYISRGLINEHIQVLDGLNFCPGLSDLLWGTQPSIYEQFLWASISTFLQIGQK